ncbi:MAG: hypothetical protein ACXWDL_00555 [Nocardioides sp.]
MTPAPEPPMREEHLPRNPPPLIVAAALVAVEGAMIVVLALIETGNLNTGRLTMGITTAVFFAVYGAGLLFCARQLTRRASWARSPVVLAQLIQLGLAWSFRGGETTWIALGLAVVALVVLVGIFHPDSLTALSDDPERP